MNDISLEGYLSQLERKRFTDLDKSITPGGRWEHSRTESLGDEMLPTAQGQSLIEKGHQHFYHASMMFDSRL